MKKRLLSAALALAMALTLLPVSVFAAPTHTPVTTASGDGTESVQYINYIDANHPSKGWYVTHVTPANASTNEAGGTDYIQVTEGISLGGRYYNLSNYSASPTGTPVVNKSIYNWDSTNTSKTGLKGQVTVIGGTVTIDTVKATSITLDVYGGSVTITHSDATTKLTHVTVSNSQYATYGKNGSISIQDCTTLTDVNLSHVTWNNSTINMISKAATTNAGQRHSVILNDVQASSANITLNGVGIDTNKTQVAQNVQITNSTVASIQTTGNGSTVTLNQMPANGTATVSMTGIGGSFNFTGGGAIGGLTVTGDTVGGTGGSEVAGAPANISIGTDCTVASINASGVAGEKGNGRNTVQITGGHVTNAINLKNSALTVSGGGTVGNKTTLGTGTISVTGNRAVMGDVELGKNATFNLTGGTNCDIGNLSVAATGDPATCTFTVPADPSNTLGGISNYTKATIAGGTWDTPVPKGNLTGVIYQLEASSKFTYYNQDQLGDAVLKQGATSGTLTMPEYPGNLSVKFVNGTTEWGTLTVGANAQIPKLPTQMNTVNTPYWSDGKSGNLSGFYPVPSTGVTLNAGGGGSVTGDVTKLTDVKVGSTASNITAKLVGNVITLSGAVKDETSFALTLETDAVKAEGNPAKEVPVTINVTVIYNSKANTLTFYNPGTDGYALSNGVVVADGFTALKLSNGTRYTLNGSGLHQRSEDVKAVGLDTDSRTKKFSKNDIDVIVNVPGYTTPTQKETVMKAVLGSDLSNPTGSFSYTSSPAVKRAINAALATVTDAQVKQWKNAARQKAWTDNGNRSVPFSDATVTAYDSSTVWLVPYLEVTVTNYAPTTTAVKNATMTANLSLKWRIEIEPEPGSSEIKANETANQVNADGVYVAKTGTALVLENDLISSVDTTTGSTTGGLLVKFVDYAQSNTWYMHQANTYGYGGSANGFRMQHAVNGNLGTVVIDRTVPLVSRYASNGGTLLARYETLQAAVDDTLDGQHIVVDSAYGGSTNITMTGKARQITIQANGKNVVVANASGGLVTQNNTGSLYTIKLNRDNTVAAGNVDIAANTAQNGAITVSANKAKTGDVITITATPNQGYKVNTITAATNTGAAVAVSATGTLNQYTLTVPANTTKVTVTPTFVVGDNKATFSVNSNTRGTASVYTGTSDGKVEQGKSATVTVIPTSGNRTMGLTAYGNNGATAPVSRTGTNSFNVTVPSGATTVTVTPSFDVDNGTPFSDVLSNHWASNEISWAYRHGYTSGKDTAYTYKPADYITRGEVVAMLWKAANSPVVNYANPFKDVPTNYWAYNAVMWAASKGLIDTSTGYFNGTGYINRADTVVILYKHANSPTVYGTSGFADVASSAYYSRAVTWARQQGLTNGYSGNTYFRPSYAISRAEVATFLYRAFG